MGTAGASSAAARDPSGAERRPAPGPLATAQRDGGGREPRRRREAGSLSGSTGRPPPPPPHLRPLRGTAGVGSSGTEIRHGRLLPGTREGGAAGART